MLDMTSFRTQMQEMLSQMFETFSEKQSLLFDDLHMRINDIDTKLTSVQTSNQEIESKLSTLNEQVSSMQNKLLEIDDEQKSLSDKLIKLDIRLSGVERSYKKTCIEIRNTPKVLNEKKNDLFNMAYNLTKFLGMEHLKDRIRDVHRFPAYKNSSASTINIEFSDTLTKWNILKAAKQYNRENPSAKLNSVHLKINSSQTPLYISESLSQCTKQLYYLTRQFIKTEGYLFCWVINDKVYIREKEGAPHILVKSEEHLQLLKK
ncbi:unnamed protein product [Leptosia nina]|uniref:FP protein C-terminal domain-containing protein n=1 Tax=Leptosia nina TaxID=320188 RepID=A0AAV1JX25_9NEOP